LTTSRQELPRTKNTTKHLNRGNVSYGTSRYGRGVYSCYHSL
jgi:hypothetical protein